MNIHLIDSSKSREKTEKKFRKIVIALFTLLLSLLLSSTTMAAADSEATIATEQAPNKITTNIPKTLADNSVSQQLLQTTLGLFFVLAVIIIAAWLFRRYGHFQGVTHRQMKILAAVSLGSRERAILLQVGNTQLVVGVTAGQIRTLHTLEQPLAVDNPSNSALKKKAVSFSQQLKTVLQKKA